MNNFLAEIYQHKLAEIALRKNKISVQEICDQINCHKESSAKNQSIKFLKSPNFFEVLKAKDCAKETTLICEIKRGSPSAGLIRQEFDPVKIAKIYQDAGASCLSVLTEERYFLGSDEYLQQVRKISNLPLLRKDFMIDSYQIYEAKLLGADCILLIVALLDDEKLIELETVALNLGLSVLIEIHDESELRRASKLKSKLLGINNRDLKTLKTDIATSLKLASIVPSDYVLISESGIKSVQDIQILKQAGINCFLIGEHFIRQTDIAQEVRKLIQS